MDGYMGSLKRTRNVSHTSNMFCPDGLCVIRHLNLPRSTARGVSTGHVLLVLVTIYQLAHLGTGCLLHADGARDELCLGGAGDGPRVPPQGTAGVRASRTVPLVSVEHARVPTPGGGERPRAGK